jgi:hypothetical protein
MGFITFIWMNTRHKERMSLIETGQSADLFNKTSREDSSLKWGLVLLALGVGLGIGISIDIYQNNDGPVMTMPIVTISSGLGFIIYYLIISNKNKRNQN